MILLIHDFWEDIRTSKELIIVLIDIMQWVCFAFVLFCLLMFFGFFFKLKRLPQ